MALKFSEAIVYGPADAPRAPAEHPSVRHTSAAPPSEIVQMADHEIEKHKFRDDLKEGEGWACVTTAPGDEELGQVFVGVQFEGQIHAYNDCIKQQCRVLEDVAGWLEKFFAENFDDVDFEVRVDAVPCPKATTPLVLDETIARLEKRQAQVGPVVGPVNEIQRQPANVRGVTPTSDASRRS